MFDGYATSTPQLIASQIDLLSSLPECILHRVCLVLGNAGYPPTTDSSGNKAPRLKQLRPLLDGVIPSADNTAHSSGGFSPLAFASENTPTLQILRLCCKLLKRIVDNVRPSISFPLEDLQQVEPFLRKLPNLSAVTLRYCFNKTAPDNSLTSLHSILPALTSLSVNDNRSPSLCKYVVGLVPLWGSTLQCLQLCEVALSPCHNTTWRFNNEFGFLEELQMLRNLSLYDVTPHLLTEDIVGRTRLLSLDLRYSGQPGLFLREGTREDDSSLDVSSCTSLRDLRCVNYSLKRLLATGLSALLRLDCSNNDLEDLDLTACVGIQHVACVDTSLGRIDVSGCTDLRELECQVRRTCNILVAGCSHLQLLKICQRYDRDGNAPFAISQLDLSGCTGLIKLAFAGLRGLGQSSHNIDLEGCPNLECLDVSGDIDDDSLKHLEDLQKLHTLRFKDGAFNKLYLEDLTSLESLECVNCYEMVTLAINGCSSLRDVLCKDCPRLEDLDCEGCTSLKHCVFRNRVYEPDYSD